MQPPCADSLSIERIIEQLRERHYAIIDRSLSAELLSSLDLHFRSLDESKFKPAGVGRASSFQTNNAVRSDVIHWLEQDTEATKLYFAWMEALRLRVNQVFFLGLFDYECHYACFPPGSFYQRHVDAFNEAGRERSNRRLTTILYLNHDWKTRDGGQLKIYHMDEGTPPVEVVPEYGRMVVFFSELFPHEVCMAHRPRRSVTGWFHINSCNSRVADPVV